MVTTEKVSIEYTQEEMRRKSQCFTTKKKSAKHKSQFGVYKRQKHFKVCIKQIAEYHK